MKEIINNKNYCNERVLENITRKGLLVSYKYKKEFIVYNDQFSN